MSFNPIQPGDPLLLAPELVFQPDQPHADGLAEGFYLHRRRARVTLAVRIWFGPPVDLEGGPGAVLDRGWRWQVEVGGDLLDDERAFAPPARFEDIWPRCRDNLTSRAEVDYLNARIDHARRYDPNDPFGQPSKRIDMLSATIPE